MEILGTSINSFMPAKKKKAVRRRRPGWTPEKGREAEQRNSSGITTKRQSTVKKEAIPPQASIKEDSQILETEKKVEETPKPKTMVTPKPRLGTQGNPIRVRQESDIIEAFTIFFQTNNPDDIFVKSERVVRDNNGNSTFKVVHGEDVRSGLSIQLWFDITSFSVL